MNIDKLREQHTEAGNQARLLLDKYTDRAKAEGRTSMNASERAEVEAAIQKVQAIQKELDGARGDASFKAELNRLTAGTSPTRRGGPSIGAQIINSELGQWLTANRGKFPSGVWTSPVSSEVRGFDLMAATISEDVGSGGGLVVPDYQPGIVPMPTRELTIADLMAPGTTTSNSVSYMKETSIINAAGAVAEGAPKPESTIIFSAAADPVRKIATWLPVTEEILEDVPTLRGYLDTRLKFFVQLAEDDQLLSGDGTAPNISGILDRPGLAPAVALTAPENGADAILRQISAIETATSMRVDGIVIAPAAWDKILLLKDTTGNYLAGGGPFGSPLAKTLWGRNVSVTPAAAAGTAVVGAFRTASQFFRRGGLRVEASNSHQDFFITNKIALRAEERGALCVYREAAFGKVTGL